jgi:hypothetical protein
MQGEDDTAYDIVVRSTYRLLPDSCSQVQRVHDEDSRGVALGVRGTCRKIVLETIVWSLLLARSGSDMVEHGGVRSHTGPLLRGVAVRSVQIPTVLLQCRRETL